MRFWNGVLCDSDDQLTIMTGGTFTNGGVGVDLPGSEPSRSQIISSFFWGGGLELKVF